MLQNYFFKHLKLSDRNVRSTIKIKTIGRTDILVCPNSCATPTFSGMTIKNDFLDNTIENEFNKHILKTTIFKITPLLHHFYIMKIQQFISL